MGEKKVKTPKEKKPRGWLKEKLTPKFIKNSIERKMRLLLLSI